MNEIYLRPHHGLCIQHYVGQGYDEKFTKNMNHIIRILENNPKQEIILLAETDALCAFCPKNRGGVCESKEKVAEYDKKCLSLCGFYDGQRLSWYLFRKTIAEVIIKSSKLRYVCEDCNWLSLCENIVP